MPSPDWRIERTVSEWHAKITWSYVSVAPPAVVNCTVLVPTVVLTDFTGVDRCSCDAGSFDRILLT
jgi:hypothetical protein